MYLWCHLSLVTFAFTLSMLQFAPCLWVEFQRDRLGFLSYENGYLPRCNLTHNEVTHFTMPLAPCVSPIGAFSFPQLAVYTLKNLSDKAHAQYRGV